MAVGLTWVLGSDYLSCSYRYFLYRLPVYDKL